MSIVNDKYFSESGRLIVQTQFKNAKPFPHIALDNFIDEKIAKSLYQNFPRIENMRKSFDGYNENKSEDSSFENLHEDFIQVKNLFHSTEFLQWLEFVTGIKGLMIPNDFRGAGLHQGKNGSFLDVHVDFSVHSTLNKHRRLNVLIFLNDEWKEEWGGLLELWNKDVTVCEHYLNPILNRCVIFECSEISFHGYDKITCPENQTRKSFYGYFYTDVAPNVKYHDTIFKARPTEGVKKKVLTDLKETSKNMIKKTFHALGFKSFFEKTE
jgi:Rps23 Pro-64 3,4-dihydroxylase Tpa1-like proline 4-hydroxylase